MGFMPCGTLGCSKNPRWLFASIRTRRLQRYCNDCCTGMLSKVMEGTHLVLAYSRPEDK